MEKTTSNIASPCVRNCCLNDEDICLGCFRSLEEIKRWSESSDTLRLQTLNNAAVRRETHPVFWDS